VKQGVLVDSLNFSPKLDTLYLTSGATTNRKFDLASNRDWTISSNQSWCNVSPLSGIGNASFFISTATNPGATRIAKITLVSGLITRILYVNQTGGFFIDSLYVFADSIMRSAEAFPTNLIDIGCNRSWTASSNQSWATVTPTSGTNNGTINVSITANSGAARTAIITVTAGSLMRTVSIQQAAFVDSLSLSADSLILSAAASATNTIQVMSNKTWTVSSNQTWATVTPTSGNNNGSFNINIAANSGAQRTATITVTAGSKVKTVTVKQATFVPVPDSITLNMDTLNVGTAGGATNTIQVFSNTNWTISANQTWVTLSPTSGNNNGTFNINVAANTGTQRTATVTATAGTASKILIVNQGGLTAVEDVKSSFFSIYPNPVNDILHIDLKNTCRKGAISIFDVTGKEVMKEDVSKLIKIELDLSYLHRGMYFIQLIEDGNKHTSKLLVN
jgi:ribosomal protein L14